MNEANRLTDWKYRLILVLIFLLLWFFALGILQQIPEKHEPYYALVASAIFLVDLVILSPYKKQQLSEDEKRTYPFFLAFGIILILVSLILIYTKTQPNRWIFSFLFPATFFTSMVILQYIRDRKIIP